MIKHARIFTKLLPQISRLISSLKIHSLINVEEIQVFVPIYCLLHILSSFALNITLNCLVTIASLIACNLCASTR